MRLRKPCEHGRYDEHVIWNGEPGKPVCPGGEFLADDARRVWWCGYRQSTASPQDWMGATYEWHQGALHMVDQRMEDVLPWCPICRMDGGLHLAPDDPRACRWVYLLDALTVREGGAR